MLLWVSCVVLVLWCYGCFDSVGGWVFCYACVTGFVWVSWVVARLGFTVTSMLFVALDGVGSPVGGFLRMSLLVL